MTSSCALHTNPKISNNKQGVFNHHFLRELIEEEDNKVKVHGINLNVDGLAHKARSKLQLYPLLQEDKPTQLHKNTRKEI